MSFYCNVSFLAIAANGSTPHTNKAQGRERYRKRREEGKGGRTQSYPSDPRLVKGQRKDLCPPVEATVTPACLCKTGVKQQPPCACSGRHDLTGIINPPLYFIGGAVGEGARVTLLHHRSTSHPSNKDRLHPHFTRLVRNLQACTHVNIFKANTAYLFSGIVLFVCWGNTVSTVRGIKSKK